MKKSSLEMKNMSLLLVLLLVLTSTPATADPGRQNSVPASCPTEKSSPAFSLLTGNIISGVTPRTRHETVQPSVSLEKKGEIAALSFLPSSAFSPYVGAGLNKSNRGETVLEALVNREQSQAYQLGAGVGCTLGNQTHLGLDYRYTPAADSSLLRTVPSGAESNEERYRIFLDLKIHF